MIVDSHCHLADDKFAGDLDAVVARARDADLVLWLMDATDPQPAPPADLAAPAREMLWVLNKMDLPGSQRLHPMPELTKTIEAKAHASIGTSEARVLTQARHRRQLEACLEALETYLAGAPGELDHSAAAGFDWSRRSHRLSCADWSELCRQLLSSR